ncbi:hypothetical protein [Pseudomonas phage vB_PseuGesM_254]|uniref:Uncharacterized protein n=1 Tax=Pseudomonas phage vB_PseuGesM_254 TaxID=3092638 RepID=A0AAX4G6N3_9CAUD|nr:hypothetical protein [Pseudomonas phage PseuGes_254]
MEKTANMDMDIFKVLTHSLKLATLLELQTTYNTEDLYEMLEAIDMYDEMQIIQRATEGNNQ